VKKAMNKNGQQALKEEIHKIDDRRGSNRSSQEDFLDANLLKISHMLHLGSF